MGKDNDTRGRVVGSNSLLGERIFLAMVLHCNVQVDWFGGTRDVPLTYADGMVGAIPVFSTRAAAEAFSNGRYGIVEVEAAPPNAAAQVPDSRSEAGHLGAAGCMAPEKS